MPRTSAQWPTASKSMQTSAARWSRPAPRTAASRMNGLNLRRFSTYCATNRWPPRVCTTSSTRPRITS